MSEYPFDKDTGNAGKAEARRLKAQVGGEVSGFRTVIHKDIASGTETMLRTKGGMPEVTRTTGKKRPPEAANRTFVFKNYLSLIATIANRLGSGMKVVVQRFAAKQVTYSVGSGRTDTQSFWRDVFRVEEIDSSTCKVGINGKVAAFLPTTIPNYGKYALPWLAGRQSSCDGDATRSTIFIGRDTSVASVGVNGLEKSTLAVTSPDQFVANTIPVIRLAKDGSFRFYGSKADEPFGLDKTIRTSWAIIKPTLVWPYLAETETHIGVPFAYEAGSDDDNNPATTPDPNRLAIFYVPQRAPSYSNSSYTPVVMDAWMKPINTVTRIGDGTLGDWNIDYDYTYGLFGQPPSEPTKTGGYGTYTANENIIESKSIKGYGYKDSDLEISLEASLVCRMIGNDTYGYGRYMAGITEINEMSYSSRVMTTDSTTTLRLSNPILGDLFKFKSTNKMSLSQQITSKLAYSPSPPAGGSSFVQCWSAADQTVALAALANPIGAWHHETYGGTTTDSRPRPQTMSTILCEAKDFIYADVDEEIFVTLECVIRNDYNGNYPAPQWATPARTYSLTFRYVLTVRGTRHEYEVYSGSEFDAPIDQFLAVYESSNPSFVPYGVGSAGWGYYSALLPPSPVFAPAFMGQGNCSMIAYTTKDEEAAGCTPEIYVDFSIVSNPYTYTALTDGVLQFGAQRVGQAFLWFVCGYIFNDTTLTSKNFPLWQNKFFKSSEPFRLQFSNGVKGPPPQVLDPELAGNPLTVTTRI